MFGTGVTAQRECIVFRSVVPICPSTGGGTTSSSSRASTGSMSMLGFDTVIFCMGLRSPKIQISANLGLCLRSNSVMLLFPTVRLRRWGLCVRSNLVSCLLD